MKATGSTQKLAIYVVAYLTACLWGAKWATGGGAALWPPDAVLLCALLFERRERWWWYLAVALPMRWFILEPAPTWIVLALYANDALKAVLSAVLLRRLLPRASLLQSLRDFTVFILVAALLSPALSGLAGAVTRMFLGNAFWPVWLQWFLGDSLAVVALVPPFLFIAEGRFRRPLVPVIELTVLGLGVVLSSWAAFWYADPAGVYTPILVYAPIPFLVWAALRAGPAGVSLSLPFIVLFALSGAEIGHGPFAVYGRAVNVLALQLFMLVLALPVTALALLIDERRQAQQLLARNEQELQAQNVQLRTLAGRLITAYEDERQRISRDLHDDIGQRLALIAMAIDRISMDHRDTSPADSERLLGIRKDVHELAGDLHGVSRELYSSTVQHLGLEQALKNWCAQMATKHQLAIDFKGDGNDGLPRDVSICLYRVAQEALNNAVKHGRAGQVKVELTAHLARVRLRVVDSGDGFDPTAPTNGIGLASMRERLRFIGGDLFVMSAPGSGAELIAEIPVN